MTVSPSRESIAGPMALPIAVGVAATVCLWRLYRRCILHVHPNCVTVVYETRRKTILATSMDKEREAGEDMMQVYHFRPLMCMIGHLLYSSKTTVLVPPSSFFSAFTLPRAVFDEKGEGGVVDCVLEAVQVKDGCVRMGLAVRYCIPFEQLERYLAAVGPTAPNEHIAKAAAAAAEARAAELSMGLIINKARREDSFLQPFRLHLEAKLISEACVKLIDVTVVSAEICEQRVGV